METIKTNKMRFDKRFGDSEYLFREMVKQHRLNMTPRQREKKILIPREFYPSAIERKYSKQVVSWMKELSSFIDDTIELNLQKWVDDYDSIVRVDSLENYTVFENGYNERVDSFCEKIEGWYDDSLRTDSNTESFFITDAYTDDLDVFEADYNEEFNRVVDEQSSKEYITGIGYDVGDFQEKQWQKQVAAVLGAAFIVAESWESELVKNWANTNYGLIKKLSREQIGKVNFAVSNGVQTGQSVKDIKAEILKINKNISGARAQLIAQDQTGKLKTLFSKRRQEEVGIDLYVWVTAGDERVRKLHISLDGLICKWEDSSVYSTDGIDFNSRTGGMTKAMVGQDVRCRCGGSPAFPVLVAIIDAEIKKEAA